MIKKIISILSVVLLLASCSHEVLIDNPTKNDVKVIVKGKEVLVKANSIQKIKVAKGLNSILSIASSGDTLVNENVEIFNEGLLNVTKSNYAIWKDVFCEEADYEKYKVKLNLKDTVVVGGLEFVDIDLVLLNDVFIAKTWDLGIDKNMPESVEIAEDEKFKIVSKIYHVAELKEVFNYYGDYDFTNLTEEEINKLINNRENN
jgi:hypothetical protein